MPHSALLQRATWKPFPHVMVLTGEADFFKHTIVKRYVEELFATSPQEVRRYQGPPNESRLSDLPLATVLDELRTPSFFSPHRLVVVESANTFVDAHGADLVPFFESGFSGGHLVLYISGKLDGRTRFAKAAGEQALVVDCVQPYDRPPPWETGSPVWRSDLSSWLVDHARSKGLDLDLETAFVLHSRAGVDLGVLDEELGKIATYLTSKAERRVTAEVIAAVVGDLREDSIFVAVDLILSGKKREAVDAVARMITHGVSTDRASATVDPMAIALLFIGALIPRLRLLRRAHALQAEGGGPDRWMAEGIVQKPFLSRFQRELAATPPSRIARLFDLLHELDRSLKTGGEVSSGMELLVLRS